MRQSRIRNARKEFARAYPEVGEKVQAARLAYARKIGLSIIARNVLIGLAAAGAILWRCAL